MMEKEKRTNEFRGKFNLGLREKRKEISDGGKFRDDLEKERDADCCSHLRLSFIYN